jgi:hypothetical protein
LGLPDQHHQKDYNSKRFDASPILNLALNPMKQKLKPC